MSAPTDAAGASGASEVEPRTSWNPANDGIDHINIYSKGKTTLGRWLSNFAREPMMTDDGRFDSVEGYWYWLLCRNDGLRAMHGFHAKDFGRSQPITTNMLHAEFQRRITNALRDKADARPDMLATLRANQLPLTHYYVFGGKTKHAGHEWLTRAWQNLAEEKAHV